MSEGKVLLVSKNYVRPDVLEALRRKVLRDLEDGVAVVPIGFDVICIPGGKEETDGAL